MLRKMTAAVATAAVFTLCSASAGQNLSDKPQVIKLERFRKALWTVRVTVDGKAGEFLFDTGG